MSEQPLFKALDKLDQLAVFSEYVTDTEKQAVESKRLEERTKARKRREVFRDLLDEFLKTGELTAASHWQSIVQKVKEDPRYTSLAGHPGSSPQELFNDVVEREKEKLKDHIDSLNDSLHDFEFKTSTSYEDILEHSKEALETIPDNLRVIIFRILYDEALINLKERERRLKKELKRYDDYLKSNANIASNSTFSDFDKEIKDKFPLIPEQKLIELFEKFVEKLKEEEASEIEPGEIKNKSKKRDKREKDHKKHKKDRHKSHHKHRSSRSPVKFI